jgi:hypothetical protein
VKHGIAVEARKATPNDARITVYEGGESAIPNNAEVEVDHCAASP